MYWGLIMGDVSVGDALESGLLEGISELGTKLMLVPLDWRVVVVEDLPFVEGVPQPGQDAIAVCTEWAHALGMQEYGFDEGDGIRSWYLMDGIWEIEISTLTHAA